MVTSGLAVTITALGTYLTERARAADDIPLRRCELASAFLSDETPSPYIGLKAREILVQTAVNTLERCLREQR